MKKLLFSSFIFLLISGIANAEMIDVFRANLNSQCGQEVSLKAQNIVIGIIKARKKSEDPCNDQTIKDIVSKCSKGTCEMVIKMYGEVFENSGKVIGK